MKGQLDAVERRIQFAARRISVVHGEMINKSSQKAEEEKSMYEFEEYIVSIRPGQIDLTSLP